MTAHVFPPLQSTARLRSFASIFVIVLLNYPLLWSEMAKIIILAMFFLTLNDENPLYSADTIKNKSFLVRISCLLT